MSGKFPLGQTVITRNALDTLQTKDVYASIARHERGDWGDLCAEDIETNERALKDGGRLFSRYDDSKAVKFYIITEADRSATTVLLPEDY
jgi:hypothetical protein